MDMIPAGASVALKPNLVVAGTPERGATTHTGVLSGCVAYLRDHGVQDISIIEGSWVGDNTDRAARACGYDQVCKRYCQTIMTCALKNCKGCLPDREKRRFHSEGLTRPIAALAAALRPDLTIVDSICGDLSFEEGGNPI